jgi:hypothetical protein
MHHKLTSSLHDVRKCVCGGGGGGDIFEFTRRRHFLIVILKFVIFARINKQSGVVSLKK